jgi:hypothetical protein
MSRAPLSYGELTRLERAALLIAGMWCLVGLWNVL